jgi:hypothetical protein
MESNPPPAAKSPLRYVTAGVRILLGFAFTVFGLNGFLNFFPPPPTLPEFIVALIKTGYMIKLLAGTQLISGIFLLVNRFVPLALALLAPVLVNIVAYHLFLEHEGIAPGLVLCVFEIYLAWAYRNAFCPMLAARVTPA